MTTSCNAEVILDSAIFGATALGIPTEFRFGYKTQRVVIRNPGKTGPGCRPIVGRDFMASVRFLVGPPIAVDSGPSSMVFVGHDGAGNTVTDTIATMVADEYEKEFNRESPPASWTQAFLEKSDMDSDPYSGS